MTDIGERTCEQCGTVATGPMARASIGGRRHEGFPPQGWEPYSASEYDGPVWCGGCVLALLDAVLEQLAAL